MAVVKHVGVWSFAKIEALMLAVFGLIEGILIAVLAVVDPTAAATSQIQEALLGPWAILALPIIYGVFGLLIGAVGASFYNLFAKWVGGIELELDSTSTAHSRVVEKAVVVKKKR